MLYVGLCGLGACVLVVGMVYVFVSGVCLYLCVGCVYVGLCVCVVVLCVCGGYACCVVFGV